MSKKSLRPIGRVAVLIVLALPIRPASADDDSAEMQAMRNNCVGDYFRHCMGMDPYGSEVRTCFHSNRKALSRDCTVAIDAYEHRASAHAARP